MCGIAGIVSEESIEESYFKEQLKVMNGLQIHRGPDGSGVWVDPSSKVGLAHVRLSIIDLTALGAQPMSSDSGLTITYNGETYNYRELREEIGGQFRTTSDTEVILKAYEKWGESCVDHLRGMFAFAIWDEKKQNLFCARDRFGIKPFYYTQTSAGFVFASEIKALLPFVQEIATDWEGFRDYLSFQFTLGEKTLFKGIKQLLPAHTLRYKSNNVSVRKYWEVHYNLDWDHTEKYFHERVRELLFDSIKIHLRSDVPVGAYLSGGLDSSIIASLGRQVQNDGLFHSFHGKFLTGPEYDESEYARAVAENAGLILHERDFSSEHFVNTISDIIYHLDYPVAGPGSFPQYMTSQLASEYLKVVLGGQGGDEIFGGYARYLVSYFEQCIKGALDGTMHDGKFVVTYESIIPNLITLKNYKPMLKEFWKEGLFESSDRRYYRLVNRANGMQNEINWDVMNSYSAFDTFKEIFWGENVGKKSYFDSMTHFDFKTLLPALLQVEDRMSMAHGLESRVPMLDHPLVEFAATIPANIKFESGRLKHLLKVSFREDLPEKLNKRQDKMGFPVPLADWMKGELKDFVCDIFNSEKAKKRDYLNPDFEISNLIAGEGKFNRKLWGLLSLELWQKQFHDQAGKFHSKIQ